MKRILTKLCLQTKLNTTEGPAVDVEENLVDTEELLADDSESLSEEKVTISNKVG